MEQWRPVPRWEGLYEVSDLGRIKSLRRALPDGRVRKEYVRTPAIKGRHYARVLFCCGARQETAQVHHIVLTVFVGPRPDGLWGLHRNGDKSDNRLTNLYYGTPQQNADDRVAHGRSCKGERHGRAKLSDETVRLIRSSSAQCRELAAQLGVSYGLISHVRNRRVWKHI